MIYFKKNKKKKRELITKLKENQGGQIAIVSIVIIVAIGLIVASSVGSMVSTEFKMTDNAVKSDMVFYSTEGALMDVLVRVKKNTSWPAVPYNDTISLNGVSVVRDITGNDDLKTIDVVGNLKSITKHLRATYDLNTGDYTIIEVEPE